ncbi:MAG TPA: PAS domain S-box protein [Tepidisphaeraceae bacterium]|jgi:PAS domain S-box-containing protein|nr:PAS domain S-box protein [Tepidisphaeraceae bacterium]
MAAPDLDALIFDTVPSMIIVLDRAGRIVRFNRACERVSGYDRGEVMGRVFWEFLLPAQEVERVKTEFLRLKDGQFPLEFKNEWVTKDGARRLIAWSNTTAPNSAGDVEFLIGTGQDVTDLRRAEHDLLESERRYRTIVETAIEGIWVIDAEGRTTYVNQSMADMFGYAPAEMLGRSMYDFMDDHARVEAEANMERRRQGITEAHEFRFRHKTGSDVWTLLNANPLFDEGRFIGALAMVADITGRKETEWALRESEERFRAQHDNLPLPTFTWRRAGDDFTLITFNKAAQEMTGGAVAKLLGIRASQMFATQPHVARDMRECMERREPVRREMRYTMQSIGKEMDLAATYAFIPPDLVMVHTEDVGPRRQAERELLALNQTLEQRVAERTATLSRQTQIFQLVLESMGDGVLVSDERGTLLLDNPALARMTGQGRVTSPGDLEARANSRRFFKADGVTPYTPYELPIFRAIRGEFVPDEQMCLRHAGRPDSWVSVSATPMRDDHGALRGGVVVVRDMAERRQAEEALLERERHSRELAEYNRLLITEVEHRVGNNLAGLMGLVELMGSRAASVPAFADAMQQRLRAMAQTHHLLSESGWKSVALRTLAVTALDTARDPARPPTDERAEGPDVEVSPSQAQALNLILFEWYTNSCKYGAHAVAGGTLRIAWELNNGSSSGKRVTLTWKERNGPPPRLPAVPSLGTELVHAFAARELGGTCSMTFPPDGAEHVIEFSATP